MINVSAAWHRALNADKRDFLERVTITLKDNTVLHLTNENIWQGGFSIDDAVSADSDFQIGAAIVNKFSLTINNIYDDYTEYDFGDAEVVVEVGLSTDESVQGAAEYIQKGIFTVDQATYNGSLIRLECLDRMKNFDRPYSESTLVYPASLNQIILDACQKCQVVLGTLNFPHKEFIINTSPEKDKVTFREVVSWVAQIAGCYARISNVGKLELKWYDRTALEGATGGTDGGVFDETESSSYQTGDTVNGGTFNPWNTGDVLDGGTLVGLGDGVHFIHSMYSKDISVDDVIITGVSFDIKTGDNSTPIEKKQTGSSGYVISIANNDLITLDNYASILAWLGTQLIGLTFRKASISHGSDPSIEAGDVAIVFDGKGNQYPIVVSRTVFSFGTAQKTISSAQTPARNASSRQTAETKNYVELSRKVQAEKSARELAEQSIRRDLASSSGLYYTSVPDEDDPTKLIYYLHNKSALAQSDVRIRFSEGGIAVTSNGTAQNPTWYGLTPSGDMILNLLSTTGIRFDWAQGGELTLGGSNNLHGELKILDASGNESGKWNNQGINLGNGNFIADSNGAVTAKSLTADDYIYVDGGTGSYFHVPSSTGGSVTISSSGILMRTNNGLVTRMNDPSWMYDDTNTRYWDEAEMPDNPTQEDAAEYDIDDRPGYNNLNVVLKATNYPFSDKPTNYVAIGYDYIEVSKNADNRNGYGKYVRINGAAQNIMFSNGRFRTVLDFTGFEKVCGFEAYYGPVTIGGTKYRVQGGVLCVDGTQDPNW